MDNCWRRRSSSSIVNNWWSNDDNRLEIQLGKCSNFNGGKRQINFGFDRDNDEDLNEFLAVVDNDDDIDPKKKESKH